MGEINLDSFVIELAGALPLELSRILDEDNTWERVAVKIPSLQLADISSLRRANSIPYDSPGKCLLRKIGCSVTVGELAKYLDDLQLESALMLFYPFEPVRLLEQPPTQLIVDEGRESTLTLQCNARGFPYPHYQWFKWNIHNEIEELLTEVSSTLSIKPVRLYHEGLYTCKIYNSKETGERSCAFTDWIQVLVNPSPYGFDDKPYEKLEIELPPIAPANEICIGGSLLLSCKAKGRYPLKYTWFKDETPIYEEIISEDKVSTFTWLTIQPENGKSSWAFHCKVSNNYGEEVLSGEVTVSLAGPVVTDIYTAEDKVALLIGNSDYQSLTQLHSPTEDIVTFGNSLKLLGFKVLAFTNLNFLEMKNAVNLFAQLLDEGVFALFYYVGHGFSLHHQSYMLPVDAPSDYKISETLCSEYVLVEMQNHNTKLNVIFLDMCLKEPEGHIDTSVEYKPKPSPNTIYFFATTKFCSAYEVTGAQNGIFMKHLKKFIHLKRPLTEIIETVKADMMKDNQAGDKQFPWSEGNCRFPYSLVNRILPMNKERFEERKQIFNSFFKLPMGCRIPLVTGSSVTVMYEIYRGLILNSLSVKVKTAAHSNLQHWAYIEIQKQQNLSLFESQIITNNCTEKVLQTFIFGLQKAKEPIKATLYVTDSKVKHAITSFDIPLSLIAATDFWVPVSPVEEEEPAVPFDSKEFNCCKTLSSKDSENSNCVNNCVCRNSLSLMASTTDKKEDLQVNPTERELRPISCCASSDNQYSQEESTKERLGCSACDRNSDSETDNSSSNQDAKVYEKETGEESSPTLDINSLTLED